MSNFKISIITATYNSEKTIRRLLNSILEQEDQKFQWIVIDGNSTDNTLSILREFHIKNLKIVSEPDFGIYDALNKGIKISETEYYIVIGADDVFYKNAIADYNKAIEMGKYSFVTSLVKCNNKILSPKNGPSWLNGQFKWVSAHAVGLLIKKELHLKYGYYSSKFPIAADQLFIKQCCISGEKVKFINKVVGEFSLYGLSSIDKIGVYTECFRVQLITENKKLIIYIIFILKLIKYFIFNIFLIKNKTNSNKKITLNKLIE